ncbi:hypothetical protein QTO34_011128 [Cnephaeus nilssonii]|uniref:C2 domain-containing protein n=1 Tax=Cnephaeus nilssonii TaxID=3371016 RepID=A0AA40HD80_CNENI|nr:hypothetical protein QTO34_011128 [Eptesicus nilssonii]
MNVYSWAVKPSNFSYGDGAVVEGQPPATSHLPPPGEERMALLAHVLQAPPAPADARLQRGLRPRAAPATEQPTSIGRIKPELYKQKSVDGDDAKSEAAKSCGKINFTLRYDYETETLIVRILKAFDLPAKDFCGSSDPYVKIYLLPDRKCKQQTRVHRKTLNPTFDESFHFPVPYEELATASCTSVFSTSTASPATT